MIDQHPITPPLELVQQWADMLSSRSDHAVFSLAARWGADQELEACCAELESIPSPLGIPFGKMAGNALRTARRPKLPSLKEQALAQLDAIQLDLDSSNIYGANTDTIRKALEALPNG
jgi:hypothetical protein